MKLFSAVVLFLMTLSIQAGEVLKFDADYVIPSHSPEEEALSTYTLEEYVVVKATPGTKEVSSLSYKLPYLMTGTKGQTVAMKLVLEQLPLRVFEGKEATALCEGPWNQMKCSMRFKKLKMKLGRLENYLEDQGINDQEISTRINMLKRFGGEPVGKTLVKAKP